MTADLVEILDNRGTEIVHIPVLLGAIGVFHSVPIDDDQINLNLTACLLARIYSFEIRDWKHPDITALNPGLRLPIRYDSYGNVDQDQSYPITVARRDAGSSSTQTFTAYLNKACPETWPIENVGSTVAFHPNTKVCPSSSLVECVTETPGTIFYLDSGTSVNSD
jgi:phosphate transport system substrate-binding protein